MLDGAFIKLPAAYLICGSAFSTWALSSPQFSGHRANAWDNFVGRMNKYMKKHLVESGSDELKSQTERRRQCLRVVSKLHGLPKG